MNYSIGETKTNVGNDILPVLRNYKKVVENLNIHLIKTHMEYIHNMNIINVY